MYNEKTIFVKANPYDETKEKGRFSRFDPGTRTLPQGFQLSKDYGPLPTDILFEKDVAVKLRDGVTIFVDIFRPANVQDVPVIIAWSPYGKSRGALAGVTKLRKNFGIDQHRLSGLMKWEAPDPGFWCEQGYAVCNPDARGSFHSEGNICFFGNQEGEDGYDLVEWLAAQQWCNGKVGLSGNSWLAAAQWFIAAQQPPHLAAIAPWEGLTDLYRDVILRGGIPDYGFCEGVQKQSFIGKNMMEDVVSAAKHYPLMNDYWETKIPRFEQITVPAYIVASYGSAIHTAGTFRGWEHIASKEKWLRIHDSMEWPDYYAEENLQDLKKFFDHYLKGEPNDWKSTPTVRLSLLDVAGHNTTNIPAAQFSPVHVMYEKYYLDGSSARLTKKKPSRESQLSYSTDGKSGEIAFTMTFAEGTEIVGYPKVKLWVQADGSDDMDLFVFAQKVNDRGSPLSVLNIQPKSLMFRAIANSMTRHGASILKYKGSSGRLRVSLRHLDEQKSTASVPFHSFDRSEPLKAGEIVAVEIPLFPVGLLFHKGEGLRVIVAGHNLVGGAMPGVRDLVPNNHGRHIVHTGGAYDSFLQLPIWKGGAEA